MEEFDEVLTRVKQEAAAYNWKVNPSADFVQAIIKGLIKNKHEKGEYYCPCKVVTMDKEVDAVNICMCKDARERELCVCKLFVK
jgi:ferredoxin-thioredoxin reductase catalytic subunit